MSVHLLSWAWKQVLPSGEKLVLLKLADSANDDGVCWPGVAALVSDTGMGERTVRQKIGTLVEKGLVGRVERRREDGTQRANVYVVGAQQGADLAVCQGAESAPLRARLRDRTVSNKSADALLKPPGDLHLVERPRNLPFDALAESCDADPRSRGSEIAAALNGSRSTGPGIRSLFLNEFPGGSDETLADEIRKRAQLYRAKMDGAILTPTALAKWWHDVVTMATAGRPRGLTAGDLLDSIGREGFA